jgi:hypothetical protein
MKTDESVLSFRALPHAVSSQILFRRKEVSASLHKETIFEASDGTTDVPSLSRQAKCFLPQTTLSMSDRASCRGPGEMDPACIQFGLLREMY